MKTNIKPVILSLGLGLLLFAPQQCSAFYNPSTGRWLSRDPIGEHGGINLHTILGNNPLSRVDVLGLDDAYLVQKAFLELRQAFKESRAADSTGYKHTLTTLRRVLPRISVAIGVPPDDASAAYYPRLKTLIVTASPDANTVLHEMVHAWSDIDPSGNTRDRHDEGMAYALDQGLASGVWGISVKESMLWASPRVCDLAFLHELWRDYWAGIPNTPNTGHAWPEQYVGGKLNDWRRTPFKLNAADFTHVQANLGFKISCDKFAVVLNGILAQRGCCYRFTCRNDEYGPGLISPGVAIHPVFRN